MKLDFLLRNLNKEAKSIGDLIICNKRALTDDWLIVGGSSVYKNLEAKLLLWVNYEASSILLFHLHKDS